MSTHVSGRADNGEFNALSCNIASVDRLRSVQPGTVTSLLGANTPAAAGVLVAGKTDMAGSVASAAPGGTVLAIQFSRSFPRIPTIVYSSNNASAAAVLVPVATTTGFTLTATAGTFDGYSWIVVEH